MWVYTAQMPRDQSKHHYGGISAGMQMMGPNTVVRTRKGKFDTDGAQWKQGFKEGKHIFEIVYPFEMRGDKCTVGVGTEDAPVFEKGKVSLVGNNAFSWGIDLRTRRSLHNKSMVKNYPSTQKYLPDKFYMYLDVDSGTLMFASDFTFYGASHDNIKPGKALYPMVCSRMTGCTITMVYRGQGDPSLLPNLALTPAGPPLQQPEPRREPPPMEYTTQEFPPPYMEAVGREETNMSKTTDGGPPPPPPTKMGNQEAAVSASPLPEKKDVDPIPEESTKVSMPEEGKEAASEDKTAE